MLNLSCDISQISQIYHEDGGSSKLFYQHGSSGSPKEDRWC